MAKIVFDESTRNPMFQRIQSVADSNRRRWGALTAAGVLVHLRLSVQLSLGEIEMEDESSLFSRTLMKWVAFYVIPFPKGAKAPDALTPAPKGEADEERSQLLEALDRFETAAAADPQKLVQHPLFGNCTLKFWRRIHGTHLDHHLRQFGV